MALSSLSQSAARGGRSSLSSRRTIESKPQLSTLITVLRSSLGNKKARGLGLLVEVGGWRNT